MPTKQMAMLGALPKAAAYFAPIYKIQLVRDGRQSMIKRQMGNPVDAATVLRFYLAGADREYFVVMLLDARLRVIGINTVSMGTLDSSVVTGREVFKAAMLANAHSIILGHNHPSGDPKPSSDDVAVTRDLVAAGKTLGIEVQDHIVIGELSHFSMKERGLM